MHYSHSNKKIIPKIGSPQKITIRVFSKTFHIKENELKFEWQNQSNEKYVHVLNNHSKYFVPIL